MGGWSTLNANLLCVIAATFAALAAGTAVRLGTLRGSSRDVARSRLDSLRTWWVIAILLVAAILLGRLGVVTLFTSISILGFREYLRLSRATNLDRPTLILAFLLIPLNYLWILLGWGGLFVAFIPLCGFLLLTSRLVISGKTAGFLQAAATIHWGLLLTVYCLSHAALLFTLPAETNPAAGAAGLFLYLIMLTELNDIAQALVGRQLGKHRLTPQVSPKKSWEGLLGGFLTTILLAVLLAPWLTPYFDDSRPSSTAAMPYLLAAAAGLLIAAGGILGDLTISSVKRDVGVKDSSKMLPGQGGILDRIDSLTFSAPVFYYYFCWTTG